MSVNYYPLLRTRDAELKGYSNLDDQIKDSIIPIFELTRSRRSKNNPDGNIFKRVNQLIEVVGNKPFIIDLTDKATWSNLQIESMLTTFDNGFEQWRNFLHSIESDVLIPTIHYNVDASHDAIRAQIEHLENGYERIAFRSHVKQLNSFEVISEVISTISDPQRLIIILDGGYVDLIDPLNTYNAIRQRINEVTSEFDVGLIIPLASSFPNSVLNPGYGQDEYGMFDLVEVSIFERLSNEINIANMKYGDYATVHPEPYPAGGGGWVPRVDVPLNNKIFYYRVRREYNGYTTAARRVLEDENYVKINEVDGWGDNEIESAASGNPNGRSPSHWIAVRINLHITRQFYRIESL